jgi:hypothetical protein
VYDQPPVQPSTPEALYGQPAVQEAPSLATEPTPQSNGKPKKADSKKGLPKTGTDRKIYPIFGPR